MLIERNGSDLEPRHYLEPCIKNLDKARQLCTNLFSFLSMLRTLSNKYQKDFVAAVAYFFHFEFKKIAAMIWQLFSLFYFIFSVQDYLNWTVHKALEVN